MDRHEEGKMDISEQEKTFEGFIALVMYGAAAALGLIVFIGLVNG